MIPDGRHLGLRKGPNQSPEMGIRGYQAVILNEHVHRLAPFQPRILRRSGLDPGDVGKIL